MAANEITVVFQPSGRRGTFPNNRTILDIARDLGVEIESVCGGKGVCGKCRVLVESLALSQAEETTSVSPPTEAEVRLLGQEAIRAGMRLACQSLVRGDIQVYVPEESRRLTQVVRKEASDRTVPVDPAVRTVLVTLQPPTLEDLQADTDRLLSAIAREYGREDLECDLEVVQTLPALARRSDWKLAAVVWQNKQVIAVLPASETAKVLGLAVDVGTTTVAAYLVDLGTGALLATESAMNPQVAWGDDVITRMQHAKQTPQGAKELQQAVISEINSLARKAASRIGASPTDIYDVVLVGNTAMHHLFMGIDPAPLLAAPFAPAVQRSLNIRASSIGLDFHPGCRLHVLPVEAGFVGADNVAVLIAERPYDQDEILLIIDIGTNGELVLGNRYRLLSTSCATGPALEGAHLEFGMRAAPGAIERIRIDPQTLDVKFKVIGLDGWNTDYEAREIGARGICGSGIIEAVSEMLRAGVIRPDGSFVAEVDHPRVVRENGRAHKFVIAWADETALGRDITVSLKDIRAVQLAKGALRAGAEILLRTLGVPKPDRVILAGAFGSYIDVEHAMRIGMFPTCPLDRVSSVGNAAGDGARFALLNQERRREAEWVARQVEYVELATRKDFMTEFVKAMQLGQDLTV
ncbi:MAG: ASKHA domain-containing protein [Thermoleophilia bacterium]|nr:ASKHA domain-containing protein [Thermoleophilia bacterium]